MTLLKAICLTRVVEFGEAYDLIVSLKDSHQLDTKNDSYQQWMENICLQLEKCTFLRELLEAQMKNQQNPTSDQLKMSLKYSINEYNFENIYKIANKLYLLDKDPIYLFLLIYF